MRRTCVRVLTWFAIGVLTAAGAGCGDDPPRKPSSGDGGKGAAGEFGLDPGVVGHGKGKAAAPQQNALPKKHTEY